MQVCCEAGCEGEGEGSAVLTLDNNSHESASQVRVNLSRLFPASLLRYARPAEADDPRRPPEFCPACVIGCLAVQPVPAPPLLCHASLIDHRLADSSLTPRCPSSPGLRIGFLFISALLSRLVPSLLTRLLPRRPLDVIFLFPSVTNSSNPSLMAAEKMLILASVKKCVLLTSYFS